MKIMKLSKEVRIGLLGTVSLLVFFGGYYFLKGANVFSSDHEFYCFYKNVEGLQNSASVQIRGLNVGHVTDMHLMDNKGVKVTITIGKKIALPTGTVASLQSVDLLGSKAIRLDLGPGPGTLPDGAQLTSNNEGSLVDNVSAELTPRLQELRATIAALDVTLANANAILGVENQKAISSALQSIKLTSDNLAQLSGTLSQQSGELVSIVHSANSITGNLAKENDTINRILSNASNITRQLSDAPVQKTFTTLNEAASKLNNILDRINKSDGSLGLLINDKAMYNNLTSSLNTLNTLMKDINAHPSRYINVTLIGGKKKD
jgi:phospholipid/cholesterol/gamma-HCH transport system substrate-binding protein